MNLAEAQAIFNAAVEDKGMDCPCCHRWGKYNPFKITATTCAILMWFRSAHYRSNGAWIDIHDAPDWLVRISMHARLQHWKLLEKMPKNPKNRKQKTMGFWRITPKGIDFAEGRIKVPKTAWTYDDILIRIDGPDVHIRQCTERFDYAEMMGHQFNMP